MCELYTLADGCRQKPAAAASMIRGSGSFASPSPRKPMRPSASAGTGEATSGYQITNNANPRHQQHQQQHHQMNNNNQHQAHQRFSFGGGQGPNVRRSFNPAFHQPQSQSPPRLGNHPPPPPPPASNAYYYPQQQHHRAQFNFRSSPDHQQMEKHRAGISSWLPGACKENLERLLDMNWPEISAAASS